MVTTSVPNLDPFLTEDIPCLREIQLRCVEDDDGILYLNSTTMWRSRDLFRAWGDNVVAITFWLARIAEEISNQAGREVRIGSYADFSCSLHIYGQCFDQVGGDPEKGLQSFFAMSEDDFVNRSMNSQDAMKLMVIPQLKELLTPAGIANWHFPEKSQAIIRQLITDMETGKYTP